VSPGSQARSQSCLFLVFSTNSRGEFGGQSWLLVDSAASLCASARYASLRRRACSARLRSVISSDSAIMNRGTLSVPGTRETLLLTQIKLPSLRRYFFSIGHRPLRAMAVTRTAPPRGEGPVQNCGGLLRRPLATRQRIHFTFASHKQMNSDFVSFRLVWDSWKIWRAEARFPTPT
jgi:hypothetical protein